MSETQLAYLRGDVTQTRDPSAEAYAAWRRISAAYLKRIAANSDIPSARTTQS